jgi:hypothetical protein
VHRRRAGATTLPLCLSMIVVRTPATPCALSCPSVMSCVNNSYGKVATGNSDCS